MKKIVCNSFKSSNAGIFQINSRFSEFVVDGKVLRCKLHKFYGAYKLDSILPNAECGPNDHRKDALRLWVVPYFLLWKIVK